MMAQERRFGKVLGILQKIDAFMEKAEADGLRLDQIERGLQPMLAEMGLTLLRDHVEHAGDGDAGETVTCDGHVLQRSKTPHPRRYLSIFGEMEISRYVYAAGKKKPFEYTPLDARLGLPAGETSYVLEDYQQRLCVKDPFAKATEDLKAILGTGVSVATAERSNQQMGQFAERFQWQALEETPTPQEEGELVVVAADGKGVPMRRTLKEVLQADQEVAREERPVPDGKTEEKESQGTESSRTEERPSAGNKSSTASDCSDAPAAGETSRRGARKERRKRRQALARTQAEHRQRGKKVRGADKHGGSGKTKTGRKQMAYVGAVYTIARFRRTADDVLDEVARREREKERPRPQHKQVWGEMTYLEEGELIRGRTLLFTKLALACEQRDPENKKTWICLMDGEEPLWDMQELWLDTVVPILDFFHVMEHLWKVARVLHDGRAAEEFVEHHARMLLEGKVDYAVRNFGRLLSKVHPGSKKATELRRAITYFRNNRDRMHYDEYLAQGYPIGSGVAEGTCRNLVKDRLELTGMKWEHQGAEAMIYLRSLYLNDQWDEFIEYRAAEEQKQLYGPNTLYAKLSQTAQAA